MTDFDDWRQWRERREQRLRRPHGTLALTGTYWLTAQPAPIVEGEPVLWSGDAKSVTVTAAARHGLVFDGKPIDGTVTLNPDTAPDPSLITVPEHDLLLVPIERDGVPALRVYDPNAETRTGFEGIDAFDFSPDSAVPATFEPYDASRTEQVLNADGVHRGLALDGAVTFDLADTGGGDRHTLAVSYSGGGTLHAVFADRTAEDDGAFRFRFLDLPAPDAEGRTVIDFNRAYLPPCAFADHYVCPVPPRGNELPTRIEAGERSVRRRGAPLS
jgi:uncharacterized protein